MTPNEFKNKLLGRLLIENGGLPFVEKVVAEYNPKERNDRYRLKKDLIKCLNYGNRNVQSKR